MASAGDEQRAKAPAPAAAADGVAVVELFTSEGCSSCPPADDVLATLGAASRAKDAGAAARRVYALAFHVDYWDGLGWRDRFSDPAFSERQRQYAKSFGSGRIYTPQMIISGATEFVGSDAVAAKRAIADAQSRPATVALKLSIEPAKSGNSYAVRYSTSGVTPSSAALLNVALVERGLETAVKRGENGGRKLAHENVVRWFKTFELAGDERGATEVQVPDGVTRKNASVIAYVQQQGPGRVLGAAAADLP
jgi:hypothetical protein